jgi:uncharacterized protein YbbK (DUF523 family)
MKKKVIISACLLGEMCRYDGQTKKANEVVDAFSDCEIIPFCPEAPLFGTPRERINVVRLNGQNHIITDETNKDVTQLLRDEINRFISHHPDADTIILKSKSPSCGIGTTPIYNEGKESVGMGNGIAAEIFLDAFPNTKIYDENNFLSSEMVINPTIF